MPDEVPDTGMDSVRNYTDSVEAGNCCIAAGLRCCSADPYGFPFFMMKLISTKLYIANISISTIEITNPK